MKFIGRAEELRKIKREISRDELRTILVYGRRRVGKSELIKQALQESECKSIYYECKQVTEESNTQSLCNIVAEHFDLPKLGYSKIEDLLEFIFNLSIKEKCTLVLDEYPYLRENVKGMDSILQSLIDKYKDSANITFILLGSYVDIMKSLLEHENPLFGRVDLTLNLKQMDYYDSALFYPNFSDEDKIRIYSVFGGIPYYNRLVDDSISVKENLIELIASPDARLENEIEMYLKSEISKIVNANEVIEALAKGYSKYSDILSQSHVSSGSTMVDVLDRLMRMEIVERKSPINIAFNRKKTGYFICDNLSLFYYRYIFKYASQLKIMNPDIFYDKYIAQDFEEQYVPHQFENICSQYLIRKNRAGELDPMFEKIGKYYYDNPKEHSNGEFDVVTYDEKGYVFYEVKFRKNPIDDEIIDEEISQVKATGLDCYKYVFISRSGFTANKREMTEFINLEDLFK